MLLTKSMAKWCVAVAVCAAAAGVAGCGSGTKKARARGVQPTAVTRDIPAVLRGTIGAQATLRGLEPVLVTGYGIVVGLNGTGSGDVPVAIRAELEREMRPRGVGQETRGMGSVTPSELINDRNTAVVFVQASVPPGATPGTRFDVLVEALPGTSTSSLEGGTLWTTDLRPGLQLPGGPVVPAIAQAKGEIFINPFADPARQGADAIVRTSGRILNGGAATQSRPLTLILDSPSHARARTIVNAVNTKFPQGPQDRSRTARGANEEVIEINVPRAYRSDTEEFTSLLLAMRVDQLFAQDWAVRYARAMETEPALAEDLSWCLQALGPEAIPALRGLYDFPESAPRLAALRAGARLGDALVTSRLKEIALEGSPAIRTDAISLLGDMGPDPAVNAALRSLLGARELDVRVAAYEALSRRFEPALQTKLIEDKFRLDMVRAPQPMIYISQQGAPRIVVFGEEPRLRRPAFVSGWADRLMLSAEGPDDPMRIYYQDYASGRSVTGTVDTRLTKLIEYMAHEPTPEDPAPGLGLTYSEVVGALHEIWKDGAIPGAFIAEQDKLAADLIRSLTPLEVQERPEFESELEEGEVAETPLDPAAAPVRPTEERPRERPRVVPIPPKPPSGGGR